MANCADVFNGFRAMTEHLSDELYRRASVSNPWITAIPRGTFPLNAGLVQESVTINNSEPDDDTPAWQSEAGYNADTNQEAHCALTRAEVEWGANVRNYSPEKYGWKGPLLCRDSLTFDHNVDAMLAAYIEEIKKNVDRGWTNRLREHYISYSTKAIATSAFPTTVGTSLAATAGEATLPTTEATSELTRDMLDAVAMQLIYLGAGTPDSNGYIVLGPDGPTFTVLIHPEMIQKLLLSDPEIRADYRWADAKELLKGYGVSRRFHNFQLLPDLLPPRYNYTDGAYVRVNTFTKSAGTLRGSQSVVSTDYKTAEFEAAIVLHPKAIEIEFVKPKNSAASARFNPANYMADWTWVTGAWRLGIDCEDPTEKYGRHYAELRWAIKPVFPEYGYTIIYKRCQNEVSTVDCS
jgi:hypothetical protein